MVELYKLKHYFWSLFGVLGIVLFWAGIWDGIGTLPYLENPWISLLFGLTILLSSSVIFSEFDPFKSSRHVNSVMHKIHRHPRKHEFLIKYFDKFKNKHLEISAKHLKDIEKNSFLILTKAGEEIFIPVHRIKEVLHQGKKYWKS